MGQLQINSSALQRRYTADPQTGKVEIVEFLAFGPGSDSTELWAAYYPTVNAYSTDMRDLLLGRRWMLAFVNKDEAAPEGEAGTYIFDLPFRIPDWMRRVGVDKPKLTINGSYKLVTEGSRKSGPGVPYTSSWFPSLTLDQQPAFAVKGTIGRLISVEINSEEGLGNNLRDQMKISYRGEGDELEDDIIQEIEAGNTSLSLTGTSLTGYTEEHRGLFGLKMRMRFGNLEVTTIASQEGGSQERQKLGTSAEAREFPIEDKAIDFHRHFWLSLADRADYGDSAQWRTERPPYLYDEDDRTQVEVYRLLGVSEETAIRDSAQACAYDENGNATTVCMTGRWKTLIEGTDFTYDRNLRLLSVPSGHRDITLAVRWQGDPIQVAKGETRLQGLERILIHSRNHQENVYLDPLMWRNVYNIGRVAAQDRDNFTIYVMDNEGKRQGGTDTITYVRRLGLERSTEKGKLAIDDPLIFKLEQGYMILPCLTNGVAGRDPSNCLTPMKRVTPATALYTSTVEEVLNGPTASRFMVFGRQRKSSFDVRENSFATGGQQCYDINPGTERITLNGSTVLRKGLDYEVVYETGQITLTSARARDPNAELDISYECDPPFQIQDKVLLGTRMEYKLDDISDQSLIGATVLYKSQTTTEKQPELGYEPFSHLLMGVNTRLAGEPRWMTRFANLFPFVQTEARSRANFEFEIAHSLYNPNTRNSAYIDNFDFSQNASTLPLTLYSWTQASPPQFGDDGRPDGTLDYRHQGLMVWHSSFTEQYYQIYGNTGNSYTNSREQTLLKLQFLPNDNLEGNSWGGIMRAFPQGLSNHSRKRTLEVVVRGNEGTFYADLGRVSEDISIPGIEAGRPDGRLQSEVNEALGNLKNDRDAGLDGVTTAEGEVGLRWECTPSCYTVPDPDNLDPAYDDWKEPTSGQTDESYQVNGTEGNNKGSEGVAYDTEDIDRSGTLDTLNRYLRYAMPLDSACSPRFNCEELRNGWRKYQIPLYGGGVRIDPSNTETEQSLLSNGKILRLWLGRLPKRAPRADLLLARVNIVGNNWEEGNRNTAYEVPGNVFCSGDLGDTTCITVPSSVRDSNNLRVDVINRQEERGYKQSPNTPQERDTRTDEPLPERALVLRYDNLHPGEVVHATRVLATEAKDLTRYDRLSLEVHGDSAAAPNGLSPEQGKVSFGLRLGLDQGDRNSRNYYEIKLHMDSTAEIDPEHSALWRRNSFTVRLSDLTGLKNDPAYRAFTGREITRNAWHEGRRDSSLQISVVGNPNLGNINWMRLVVYVDSGAVERQRGEIWVNDLRLEGVDRAGGTAIRSQIQLDFADFINVSANLQYTNGNFATMSQTKATPSNSLTRVDYNSNATLFANKFLPDEWAVSLPITLTYQGALSRPFTRPFSDIELGGTSLFDISRDLAEGRLSSIHDPADSLRDIDERYARVYQTTDFRQGFNVSYRKEMRSKSFVTRALLERPGMEYRYSGSDHVEYFRSDETRDYKYRLTYNLSPKESQSYRPFGFVSKFWRSSPRSLSDFQATPLPEKVNLVLADYSFVRNHTVTRPRDEFENITQTPATWAVELSHGFDLEWKPFTFFNLGYRIDVNRDFDADRECFDRESFLTGDCEGRSARSLIFAFDDERLGAGTDPSSGIDTTHLGEVYGILARERNRTQSFHADFNAQPVTWLTTGAGFNSGYRHTWTNAQEASFGGTVRPAHFEANADHEIRLTSGLNLGALAGSFGKLGKGFKAPANKVQNFIESYRLRNFDLTYVVSNKYNGEAFTYNYLREKGVSFGSFTAYQFGFVYDPASLGTIFNGVPNPGFFDYLSEPDPALGQSGMNHVVNRSVDLQSGFALPVLNLDLTGGMKYSKQYTLYRVFQASDTTVVWPEITVAGNFNDFAAKVPFVRNGLRSLTAYTNYNYREETRYGLFSSIPDMDKQAHRFAPLLRLTGTAKNDMRVEVSFNAAYETEIQYGKRAIGDIQPITYLGPNQPLRTAYERDPEKESPKRTLVCGVEPTFSWDLETQKGIQFWRYYVRLKNNLRLSLNTAANYLLTEVEQNGQTFRERNEVNAQVKPEATYNFTNNVDAKFSALYRYEQFFHTPNDEYVHEVALHGEFTMRF
jgi:hypothetical protein